MLTNVFVKLLDLSSKTMTYAHRDTNIFKLDTALPLNDDVNIHEFVSTPTSNIAILATCKAIIAFPSTTTSLKTNIQITTNAAVLQEVMIIAFFTYYSFETRSHSRNGRLLEKLQLSLKCIIGSTILIPDVKKKRTLMLTFSPAGLISTLAPLL